LKDPKTGKPRTLLPPDLPREDYIHDIEDRLDQKVIDTGSVSDYHIEAIDRLLILERDTLKETGTNVVIVGHISVR
jgi:hypothetical protein